MPTPPQSLCVLADRYLMPNEVQTLERAVEQTGIDISLVVVNDESDTTIDPDAEARAVNEGLGLHTLRILWDVLARERAWSLVLAEKKLAETCGSEAASTGRIPIEEVACLQDSEFRYVEPLEDDGWKELPQPTVEEIAQQCDLCVRFGFGLLQGAVLTAPAYGVLSFHPADIREYRGLGVPQAWLDDRDRMGVTLQRLSAEIDSGEIVAYEETDVSDCRTLWEAYDRLYDVKADLLAVGIERLRDPTVEMTVPESLGQYYSITRRYELGFSARTLWKNLLGHGEQARCAARQRFRTATTRPFADSQVETRTENSDD